MTKLDVKEQVSAIVPEVAIPVTMVEDTQDMFRMVGAFLVTAYQAVTSEAAIVRYQQVGSMLMTIARFVWAVLVVLIGLSVMAWEAWRTHQPIVWVAKVYEKAQWLIETAKVAGEGEINDRVVQTALNAKNEADYRWMFAVNGFEANRMVLTGRLKAIPTWSMLSARDNAWDVVKTARQMVAYPARTIVKGVE